MADNDQNNAQAESKDEVQLQGGTYEIIRNRLKGHSKELLQRLQKLNSARKDVFGAVESKLLSSKRISTKNNCIPRDMVPVGKRFIFGYNVFVGLRTETTLEDVFSVYEWKDGTFVPCARDLITDKRFEEDFQHLYKFYRHTRFVKFAVIGNHLFMVFRVGKSISDVKTFKWLIREQSIEYLDNRSDHQYVYPSQHEFEWTRVTQDMHRSGRNPHASIEDRVFVETVGGDLTVKIEDNTETGEGIYCEPVDDPDQTLNDAEIYYAVVGNVILMKIRPYQERQFRYIVYNEKLQKALRLDAIKDSCVLLPEDHGIIFPKGYYLQAGAKKQFETQMEDMVFEKRIASPNGEDYLYVFYNRDSGVYVLLSYNIIEQQVSPPVLCNGYSFFDDGTLIYFRAGEEAKKHHAIQIWQTPYYGPDFSIPVKSDSELYKIGNKDIVTCMAECHELINLTDREEVYSGLYLEVAKKAEEIQDSYFWIGSRDTFVLSEPLAQINEAASAAVDEFEKVLRTKRSTSQQIEEVAQSVRGMIGEIDYEHLDEINQFVEHLTKLRATRGEVISLKDLQYADVQVVESLENEVAEHTDKLSEMCAEFLLTEQSLDPYRHSIKSSGEKVPQVSKAAEAKELEAEVEKTANELEMLTDIVSNLKIADATETVAIIDNISLVYSQVNQVKASLKNKLNELGRIEGQAEFSSQLKLLGQSVINYLDICNTPEKCDEYLTKVTVQLETLESKFADFEQFIVQLAEKREEFYNAFESRKVQL
ncbi:MAG: DNA repair ATPase, partial [Planctomycetota bacterium]